MPNLCGNIYKEAGGKLSKEEEEELVWATSAIMGGGLDTVSASQDTPFFFVIFNHV